METRANYIWVGAVTLALLAALAAAIIWLARINQGEQNTYDIFFKQSVDGLAKGSQVSFAGVPAGQVNDIELWPRDPEFVRVRIRIDDKIPILQGTTATLQGSFTGVSTVQLDGAVKGAPPIAEPGPDGVPVIPTKPGGLGAILANAPLLLERLATLSDRLTEALSDKNQKSIAGILSNTDRLTGTLADTAPDLKRTLAELQATLRQANYTLTSFQKVADSTDTLLNGQGASLAQQLRDTLKSAKGAADSLQMTLDSTQPAARQLNDSTLPEAEAAIRELKQTSAALRALTNKVSDQGVGSLVGGPKLPDYKP
ncbi:MAG: MCE family protein [Sphingomonadales bacterium]|nr:MCE family protein [Sphingomonadales bacterium]MDE2567488.1 MCE family protein [Sphingomonadales bacterium]